MHHTLEIPELLEAIFAFLSRKDLYRSCTRVNHQWNAVSRRIIQEKRKAEFIKIPGIRDNILFHIYGNQRNLAEFINYCDVSETWSNILNHLRKKDRIFTSLNYYNCFLNYAYRNRRKQLFRNKRRLIFFMDNRVDHCLKHDREISRYYQDILSQYDVGAEFLRLSRVCRSYDFLTSTENEFRRLAKTFLAII
jgi:hypothetical protein